MKCAICGKEFFGCPNPIKQVLTEDYHQEYADDEVCCSTCCSAVFRGLTVPHKQKLITEDTKTSFFNK